MYRQRGQGDTDCRSGAARHLLPDAPVPCGRVGAGDVRAASAAFVHADAAILTAAVADYTPEQVADEKIKREKTGEMSLNLKPTRDIAAFLGNLKNDTEHQRRLLVALPLRLITSR